MPLLNQHQRSIYDNVIDAVHDPMSVDKTFFVDGLGGAGKTFLYECLLNKVRSTSDITLSMASFGIAALLLEGDCTAHSRFKIPIAGLCGSSTYYVPLNSPQAAFVATLTFGLRPMQRGCEVAGLEVDPGVTSHAPGSAKSAKSVRE